MSLYVRGLVSWGLIFTMCMFFGALTLYQSPWFAVPFFGVIFGAHVLTDKITCPRCGNPVLNPAPGALWPKNLFRTTCANCGYDLTKSRSDNSRIDRTE